jgi:regulator of protease activity HflC (stomatin/prohibitin superfamily)
MLTVRIRKHERGLWFRHGDFRSLLMPGKYRFWSKLLFPLRDRVEVFNMLDCKFEHVLLDVLAKHDEVRDALNIVELGDAERALVWRDDRLTYIVGPGRHAFWREPYDLTVEVHNVDAVRFEHPRLATILQHPQAVRFLDGFKIEDHAEGLVFLDGKLVERLPTGLHVFWKGKGQIVCKSIDRREQIADVAGQEIMTRDKVTLRVNLVVAFGVTDAVKAVTVVTDYAQAIYREAQLVLRAAVGTRDLDNLLADKESVGGEVREALAKRAAEFGVAVRSVGLKDIILPGEMKAILNQVIEAEKQAQANLIKRREETAAARSQANTAKLLAESPALARMKELEALQEILAGAKATFVLGHGDLAEQVRGLIRTDATQA